MNPLDSFRSAARLLPFLVLMLAIPNFASSQPVVPGASELSPEVRERLSRAASDRMLPPWQRNLMLRLAESGRASALDSPALALPSGPPEGAAIVADGSWGELVVSERLLHSAIYDPVRDRMVVFGGYGGSRYLNDVWVLSLAGTPTWSELTPSGTPPNARDDQSAIYDPVRDRMVVFAGDDEIGVRNDVWELSLAGSPAWNELMPSGTPPPARERHRAIYDPFRDRMVVFGGQASSTFYDDVWALSLSGTLAWTRLTPGGTPPAARYFYSAIYDPVRDRMVVFGGQTSSGPRNDVWALSLAGMPVWTALAPGGPPPGIRFAQSAIYDSVRDRMVVFAGDGPAGRSNDVWELSLVGATAWTALTPGGPPPNARRYHSAIYDPVRDRMVMFGGNEASPEFRNDAWALSLSGVPAWTALNGTPPSARSGHTVIYDPVRARAVVFGGNDGGSRNDVWALSLAGIPVWTALTPSGTPPAARISHSAIYDPVRDRMVVFGGSDPSLRNDVWALSLAGTPAWVLLTPSGTPPGARKNHGAIYDPVRDRMVMFGGTAATRFNDVWALALAGTPAWTALAPGGAPPSMRDSHSSIYDPVRDRMLVFGGWDPSLRNDLWALSLAGTPAWAALTPGGRLPSARKNHHSIYDPMRDRMVMFGGANADGNLSDAWALWFAGPVGVGDPGRQAFLGELRPPSPNPSDLPTMLNYTIAQAGRVQLGIYDVSGRLVRRLVDGEKSAGTGWVVWNGTDDSGSPLGAGVYFVRLVGPAIRMTRKLIRVR